MEWAGISGINASAWSARGGQVSSPYVKGGFNAGGDPGGSSSGCGAGVAAGFAPLALGTDTEGSIINPSSRGALYGLRPSTGMTSRSGVVPISSSQDTTGPMGKSAWDVAVTLGIMSARDADDEYTWPAEPFRQDNYTQFINPRGFEGLRIGVVREPFFQNTTTRDRATTSSFNKAIRKISSLGAIVLDTPLPNADQWNYTFVGGPSRVNNGTIQIHYDVKGDMADYLQTRRVKSSAHTLEDVINFTIKLRDLELPGDKCCIPTFIAADQLGDRTHSGEYWLAKNAQDRLYEEGQAVLFQKYDLDVLVLPTEFSAARLGAVGRLPVGTVPLGYDDINLPYGLAFVGHRYDEATVIRAMSAYEANFADRKVPQLLA
ncbi:hypothetical protein ACHAPJ_010812 [Fusarium lateritium]